jgi:propanol-preferring alcohol dehydrogenase
MASVDIPTKQNAAVRVGSGDMATAPLTQIDVPQPKPHKILAKINWAGLYANDKSLLHDEWSGFGLTMQEATKGISQARGCQHRRCRQRRYARPAEGG